jgi:hypothetical protein
VEGTPIMNKSLYRKIHRDWKGKQDPS